MSGAEGFSVDPAQSALAFHVEHGWALPVLSAGYSSMLPQMALLPVALVTVRGLGYKFDA